MEDNRFDLEGELRTCRPQPRADFATALAHDVRGRRRQSRIGLTLALCGLIIVAVASFGGVGYASSQKPTSAASAQYKPFKPKVTIHKAVVKRTAHAEGAVKQVVAPKTTKSRLPFTGLSLWVPLAIGLSLIVVGVGLRTKGRRRGRTAH